MTVYDRNRPLPGTIRPVLRQRPWGRVDLQALPPADWCCRCGAEVYRPGHPLCQRCQNAKPGNGERISPCALLCKA